MYLHRPTLHYPGQHRARTSHRATQRRSPLLVSSLFAQSCLRTWGRWRLRGAPRALTLPVSEPPARYRSFRHFVSEFPELYWGCSFVVARLLVLHPRPPQQANKTPCASPPERATPSRRRTAVFRNARFASGDACLRVPSLNRVDTIHCRYASPWHADGKNLSDMHVHVLGAT